MVRGARGTAAPAHVHAGGSGKDCGTVAPRTAEDAGRPHPVKRRGSAGAQGTGARDLTQQCSTSLQREPAMHPAPGTCALRMSTQRTRPFAQRYRLLPEQARLYHCGCEPGRIERDGNLRGAGGGAGEAASCGRER